MNDTIENKLKYYDIILDFESFEQLKMINIGLFIFQIMEDIINI